MGIKFQVLEWSALVMLEDGLWRVSLGACSEYVFPKAIQALLVPLMMRFLIHGREEWNSDSVELRVEFE